MKSIDKENLEQIVEPEVSKIYQEVAERSEKNCTLFKQAAEKAAKEKAEKQENLKDMVFLGLYLLIILICGTMVGLLTYQ